ncbi:acyl-CoA dehydrogenase [Nostocoides sp. F2B08]|uniref:acyl-CoA dehydrogenase family protein n=1 Tax=Nostocoides sp. F2B08 TaxID=2653936 RepID=UPI001D0587C7|nr:acyl-CoA dehydrogenase [Tetrasphaera sp. F2B08]
MTIQLSGAGAPTTSDTDLAGAIRRVLDGRWGDVRDTVRRELGSADWSTPTTPLPVADYRERTTGQLSRLLAEPWMTAGFSAEPGEHGDVGASLTAFESLGHVDLSLFVKTGVQVGLFGGAVAGLGTERHHREYLAGIADGTLLGCFAMTEVGGGSDVANLETTATYDPATDEIVVHSPSPAATKDYIGNAAKDGTLAAVFAQLVVGEGEAARSHGVHCVLVPIRDENGRALPGVTLSDCGAKIGLPGVDNGEISFDHVRVPRANLLDRFGAITDEGTYASPIDSDGRRFFSMLGTLVRGRVSVGGAAGAATRNALTLAVRYAAAREQFTRPDGESGIRLLEYATHRRRLLLPLVRSYALALATNELVEDLHELTSGAGDGGQGEPDELAVRRLEERAASLKVANTAHATRTIQECREACGGAGYMWENRFGAWKADSDIFTTFEGDNTVLLQLVAKGLLTQYKDSFDSFDTRSMMLFAARNVAESFVERAFGGSIVQRLVAGAPGRDADNALEDRGGQVAILEDREEHTVATLAARMRALQGDDTDPVDALGAVQPHMVAAAWAHIDRLLLEALAAATESSAGPVRELLGRVCDLFVYSTVEDNASWFLEHGRTSAAQSKAITTRVDELCAELAPDALTLVDAFGVADAWVGCPLLERA